MAKDRVCLIVPERGMHPYCGRRARAKITFEPAKVTCSECVASMNADTQSTGLSTTNGDNT